MDTCILNTCTYAHVHFDQLPPTTYTSLNTAAQIVWAHSYKNPVAALMAIAPAAASHNWHN